MTSLNKAPAAEEQAAPPNSGFDALVPKDMAQKAEAIGITKANLDFLSVSGLSVLAGSFIALGAIFATVALTGTGAVPFGWARVIAGVVFSLGLILVVVGGAELFTGNVLIVMAWADRRVSTTRLLHSWAIVLRRQFHRRILTASLCS